MSKRNDKTGSPLSPSKTTTNNDSNHNSDKKDKLHAKIADLLLQWENLGYANHVYHDALIYLLTSENEPDSDILIGAMVIQRCLHKNSQATLGQMKQLQHWLEQPS